MYNSYRHASDSIQSLSTNNCLCPGSIFHKWQPVTPSEMEGFISIILNMGLINLPRIQDYWSKAWTGQVPFFSSIMTRERIQMVLWMLHVRHSISSPPRRINKVLTFMEPLVRIFQSSYKPSREIAADETMVGFRARFGPLQYMPNKPTKYGIKAFTLADAAHGYMLDIQCILEVTPSQQLVQPTPLYLNLHVWCCTLWTSTWLRVTPYLQTGTTQVYH